MSQIHQEIQEKYNKAAISAEGLFGYPTGIKGLMAQNYDSELVQSLPPEVTESFCGVGNPFAIHPVASGERLLDIGSGGGLDLIVGSKLVGRNGYVCGIDMTREMVKRARQNLTLANVTNGEVKEVDSEIIPYEDNSFQVVISNGVINLSTVKLKLFIEICRVLAPGGRLQFADIIIEKSLPAAMEGDPGGWAQ